MATEDTNKIQAYLKEIETWRRSARIHARNTLAQYKRVTEGLEQLYYEKKRNAEILAQLNDAVIVFDTDHRIILFNRKAESLLCCPADTAIDQHFDTLMEASAPLLLTFVRKRLIARDQDTKRHILRIHGHWVSVRLSDIRIGNDLFHLLLLEETSDLVEAQHDLEREKRKLALRVAQRTEALQQEMRKTLEAKQEAELLAQQDTLTGLLNRRAFLEHLASALKDYRENSDRHFALLFIDLDGFKTVNDVFGHYAGDTLLSILAKKMLHFVRTDDICARLGGDEFVILLHKVPGKRQVATIGRKLIERLSKPVNLGDDKQMQVSASVGAYLSQGEETDASTILARADEAMYEAKARGKNCLVFFDDQIRERMETNATLLQMLGHAMEAGEFEVHYQPICTCEGKVIGAEALGRWQHDGQMIPPGQFIPLLEQTGGIKDFTRFIVEEVFEVLRRYPELPCISINLSIQAFYDDDFMTLIERTFSSDPRLQRKVSFEITESLFHKDPEQIIAGIEVLRARGFRVYIDDFGTGFSSFSYLLNFKADVVKIDRAFVTDLHLNERNRNLLEGMVALIRSMDMAVVVEGVEHAEQVRCIQAIDPRIKIQGFHFYRPMPLEQFLQEARDHCPAHFHVDRSENEGSGKSCLPPS